MAWRKITHACLVASALTFAGGAAAQEEYVIGLTGDLSGAASGTYKPMAEGARVYFDRINDQGGINGRKIRLITRDSRGDPNQAVTDLNYFDSEGVLLSVFVSPSGTLGAYVRQNASLQIPTMYINACYPPSTPPAADPNFFCAGISTLTDAREAVDLILKAMEGQEIRLGFVTSDIPGARGAAEKIMKPYAEGKGVEVVDIAVMPVTTTDASVIARNFKDNGINAVVSYTISSHMLAGASALSQLDWDGKYLMAMSLPGVYEQMVQLKNKNILGFDHFSLPGEGKPVHKEMEEAAQKYGFGFPVVDMRMGYRSAMVVAAALEACGWPCDRDALRAVMNDLTVDDQNMLDLNLNPVIFTDKNHTSPEKVYRVYGWSDEKNDLDVVVGDHVAPESDWK